MNTTYIILVTLFVATILLAFSVRWVLYKREFSAFLSGSEVTNKQLLTSSIKYINIPTSNVTPDTLTEIESVLLKLKFSYVRKNNSICALTWLFANYPFRLIVDTPDDSTLQLTFEDRYYKNYLLPSGIRKMECRFEKTHGLLQKNCRLG